MWGEDSIKDMFKSISQELAGNGYFKEEVQPAIN